MTTKIGWKSKRNKKKRLARLEQKEEEDYWRVSVKERWGGMCEEEKCEKKEKSR